MLFYELDLRVWDLYHDWTFHEYQSENVSASIFHNNV
jgi:hypothetical protein